MVKVKNRLGFTLIELLVVIAIMAILTVIAVSQFVTAKTKAKDTQRKSDVEGLAKALDMYFADYGSYPSRDAISWGGEFTDADGYVYMKVVPQESSLDTPYCYLTDDDNTYYLIMARMEGVGSTNGVYSIVSLNTGCDATESVYNYVKASANTTVDDFCGTLSGDCRVD